MGSRIGIDLYNSNFCCKQVYDVTDGIEPLVAFCLCYGDWENRFEVLEDCKLPLFMNVYN
jgi:hypothetical protein